MSQYRWDETKSRRLKMTRGASFDDVLNGRLLDIVDHPLRAGQQMMIIWYADYCWVIPFVREGDGRFLKTMYRSRKMTRKYLERELA